MTNNQFIEKYTSIIHLTTLLGIYLIIHLDLDCYFVSAERTRTPYLNGKPVVVVKSGDRTIFSHEDHATVMTESAGAFNSIFQADCNWTAYDPDHWKKQFIDEQGRVHGIVIEIGRASCRERV